MPILKPISGHGSTVGIRRYLEKKNRALARDFFNLSWDERKDIDTPEDKKEFVLWDVEMDATRAEFGHDEPWHGMRARTFKHFVLSPDPDDAIGLAELRELSSAWALRFFPDNQIAIVYHDDNTRGIPHAHIVVNSTNLLTGNRMHTEHPEDLNRALQDMARERGLSSLSNQRKPSEGKADAADKNKVNAPRTRRNVYLGRQEREIAKAGGYTWVGDIRARVALAKTMAASEAEFFAILDALDVHVADNSSKARRDDWIFSLADWPSKKVSGERLGYTYGKQMLQRRFDRSGAYRPTEKSIDEIRKRAENAVELNDLEDLSKLSAALETCAKFDVESLEEFDARLATLSRRGQIGSEGAQRLMQAKEYMTEHGLMPQQVRYEQRQEELVDRRRSRTNQNEQRSLAARQREQQRRRNER